jgi:hypothetical protein
MPLLLMIGGSGLFLSGGYFASKTGDAMEKTGNASIKLAGAMTLAVGVYLHLRNK